MSSIPYFEQRKQVADIMTRLYNNRLTTTSGGNISTRIDDKCFAITPSSLDKGNLRPELIAIVTMEGENLTPELKLSIEGEMHRLILLENPNVNAVVHAHPTFGTLFSCAEMSVDTSLIGESWIMLGRPAVSRYFKMGTPELARDVADCARDHKIVLLKNHGVLATGRDLINAFDNMEVFENAAKMTLFATLMRGAGAEVNPLTREAMLELRPDITD